MNKIKYWYWRIASSIWGFVSRRLIKSNREVWFFAIKNYTKAIAYVIVYSDMSSEDKEASFKALKDAINHNP